MPLVKSEKRTIPGSLSPWNMCVPLSWLKRTNSCGAKVCPLIRVVYMMSAAAKLSNVSLHTSQQSPDGEKNIMMLWVKMKDAAAGIITDNVSYFKAISAIRRKGPLNALRLFKLLNAIV